MSPNPQDVFIVVTCCLIIKTALNLTHRIRNRQFTTAELICAVYPSMFLSTSLTMMYKESIPGLTSPHVIESILAGWAVVEGAPLDWNRIWDRILSRVPQHQMAAAERELARPRHLTMRVTDELKTIQHCIEAGQVEPQSVSKSNLPDGTCWVCRIGYEAGDVVITMPCGQHTFHVDCIVECFAHWQGKCPLCTKRVKKGLEEVKFSRLLEEGENQDGKDKVSH